VGASPRSYQVTPVGPCRRWSAQRGLTSPKAVTATWSQTTVDKDPSHRTQQARPGHIDTEGNLRRTTRRAVARIDADAATERRSAALAQRSVKLWDLGDGMSALHAVLPTAAAQAAFAVIDATAHQSLVPGDTRGIEAARADALVDLICFPAEMAPRIGYRIQIISPDPDLDADPTRRLPNAAQARWIRARDQHCVHPGCRATRTEDDHTIAHGEGGPTLTKNLALRCPKHHALKHLPGWSATQDPDGTLALRTPSGRTYRTRPPDPDGIDQPVEKIPPPEPQEADLPQHPPF
jgi:hypothetical protein